MRGLSSKCCRGGLLAVAAAAVAILAGAASAARPLVTGIAATGLEGTNISTATEDTALQRIRGAGIGAYRLTLDWASVAPKAPAAPSNAADPNNPAYHWASFDGQLAAIVSHGLQPLVAVYQAPRWARLRPSSGAASPPVIADWQAFAKAAATRYDGRTTGVPDVRYWIAWIEPNLTGNLRPQLVGGAPYAAVVYRSMVTAFASAVTSVDARNRVVIGGLSPFRDSTPGVVHQDFDWGPISFMRALFCLSVRLQSTCNVHLRADIWGFNPYTSGGPGHKAVLPNDVSLGDIAKLKRVLAAARRLHHLVAPHGLQLWVTEFSWDSSPPDPQAVPMSLLERWVPNALYELWSQGITLVTWLTLRDQPLATSPFQAGLYFAGSTFSADKPKPFLEGFRFPFVAFPKDGRVTVWGRTPTSTSGPVLVEYRDGGGWRVVRRLTAAGNGIFQATLVFGPRTGSMRAVFGSEASLPFGLPEVPDRRIDPFGSGSPVELPAAP